MCPYPQNLFSSMVWTFDILDAENLEGNVFVQWQFDRTETVKRILETKPINTQ